MKPSAFRLPAVLALPLLLLVGSPAPCPAGAPARFKVVQFNIRFDFESDRGNRWADRAPLVAGLIRDSGASVACLQEDMHGQVQDLERLLAGWEFVGQGRDGGRSERCSVGFDRAVWRCLDHGDFWLSDTPDVPASIGWGCRYPHKVTWAMLELLKPARMPPVLFLSTHLENEPEKDEVREKSVKVIRTWLSQHAKGAAVICGDFNAGASETAYAIMCEASPSPQPADVWEEVRPNESNPGTVHGFTGKSQKKRIDWIFTCGGLRAREIGLDRWNRDGRYPSDHFAVVAELEIVGRAAGGKGKDKTTPAEVR